MRAAHRSCGESSGAGGSIDAASPPRRDRRDALAAAERTGDSLDLLLGHVVVGFPHFYRGSFARAAEHYGHATALFDPREHASFARTLGWDRAVNAHAYLAWCHLYLGHHERALALSAKAVALAKRIEHPGGDGYCGY